MTRYPRNIRFYVGLFLFALIVYLGYQVLFESFPPIDEIVFKAAGREWASRGRFAVPEMTNFYGLTPPVQIVWLAQPPVYSFLFGLFAHAFGFGPAQCRIYDAIIHAFLAVLTSALSWKICPKPKEPSSMLAGLFVLPLGTVGRPDELAICFGLLGLLAIRPNSTNPVGNICSGCLFGLSAATSGGGACILGIVAWGVVLLGDASFGQKFISLVIWSVCAILSLLASILPILIYHPTAYEQFLSLATGQFHPPSISAYQFALRYGWPEWLFTSLACLLAYASLHWAWKNGSLREWASDWFATLLGFSVLVGVLPTKHEYLWFLGPWSVAVSAKSVCRWTKNVGRNPYSIGIVALASMLYLGCLIQPLKSLLVRVTLPKDQTLAWNAITVRRLVPDGSQVITHSYWTVLGNSHHVIDPVFSSPELAKLDYAVLTGNGSGSPGATGVVGNEVVDHYIRKHFVVIYDDLNRHPLTLFGIRITNSAYGFGPLVLESRRLHDQKRRSQREQPAGRPVPVPRSPVHNLN